MAFEKKFLTGAEVRQRWNKSLSEFFEIVQTVSFQISAMKIAAGETSPKIIKKKNGGVTIQTTDEVIWYLRPHHPDTEKPISYVVGMPWPKCREIAGQIVENTLLPEYDSGIEKSKKYLDQYLFKLTDIEFIEEKFPELLNSAKPKTTQDTRPAEEYIKQSIKQGEKTENIALELQEKYQWSLLKIARKLDSKGLQKDQIDALKQRAQRLIKKAKKHRDKV